MDSNEIRRRFLRFFEERDHTVVRSASLIPVDPTLLLTVAGMVPFKPYLLGEETPPYVRAASVQKCARTSDIDIIGTTARHMTFFEMMGNFSFGDYFKEKAIPWSYEFVTEGLGFEPERLWFTVYKDDDEAAEIWIDGVGIRPDRLQRGDKDNFWQMGVAGPCGPSSEIFVDRGARHGDDGGPIGGGEDRFVEIWNLVFMQHIQDVPYHVVGDLPAKNIDTGAGLDRIAMVLQDAESVFETDLMRPVVAAAEAATRSRFGEDGRDTSLRIMADHGRALTFLIADGVVPSNEGRGYVLRRLLRRAVRHAFLLGSHDLVIPALVEATTAVMGEAYPELVAKRDLVLSLAEREETRFRKTLESGHSLLDAELEGLAPGDEVAGSTAFKLHDTFGFPVELTEEIVTERGYLLDRTEFETMMSEQRERARKAWRGGSQSDAAEVYRSLLSGVDQTEFTGYESERDHGRLLQLVREGDVVERADHGEEIELFLDRSPFYAESGGQVGDSGTVTTETGTVRVADTRFVVPGVHGHRGKVIDGYVVTGQDASAVVEGTRRERIRKNHTGTHLLHWALREVVGDHVHQAGSLVEADRLRFDFSHFAALDDEELLAVERLTNDRIIENAAVTTVVTSKEEAEGMGALAFFGDKYGERVRVVRAGDYSTEFCGGIHVPSTGQVGPLVLVSEGSVGSNLRRVEALTGPRGYEHLIGMRRTLEGVAAALKTQPQNVLEAADGLVRRAKDQEARIEAFEAQVRSRRAAALFETMERHDGHGLVVGTAEGSTTDELRALALQLRERMGSGIGVVGSAVDGKGLLVAFVTADLVAEGLSAATILAEAARVLGGGGGRDAELAQAGGPRGDRLEESLEVAGRTARSALGAI